MKKLTVTLCILLSIFSFTFPCFAAGAFTLSLDTAQPQGGNVYVDVNISAGSGLCTTEFYLIYDAKRIEFADELITAGNAAADLHPYLTATVIEDGKLKISYTSTSALEQGGTLCTVQFEAKADTEAELSLEIEHAETFDGEHIRSLDFNTQGTSIAVTKIPFNLFADGLNIKTAVAFTAAVIAAAAIIIFLLKRKVKK